MVSVIGTVERHGLVPVVTQLCGSPDGVVDAVNRLNHGHNDMSISSSKATGR
ncbi:hypothetical protein OHA98_14945 [Streptomyces sp. NBC_00654]|uniref:hypothetical protein n=1 Tax=Streptomyces sp. NBC_00654 TaxID=2975799 RepID=UPI002258F10A|nr:hypothetical protein [Streptomyces sp. NBC_00654]MCX4966114.1 hypothetical protein [Streptomyces sp. NBC_00654]